MKVLIAHGEPLVQIGLEGALGRCEDLRVESIRERGSSCMHDIELSAFGVAVTDLDFGMRLVRRKNRNASPVLVITNDESEVRIRGAIEAGIRGYLLQSSTLDSVVEAVRRVGQGGSAIDPRVLTRMIDSLHGQRLTDREIDVLRLIALGRSNKAVANQ